MRKSVLFLTVAVLAVAGCKSKRELAAGSEVKVDETVRTTGMAREKEARDSAGSRVEVRGVVREEEDEVVVVTRVTEYDTSKGAAAGTGCPPVARVTETERRSRRTGRTAEGTGSVEESRVAAGTERVVGTDTERQLSGSETTEVKQSRKRTAGGWPWWLAAVTVAVVWWRVRAQKKG